MFSQIKQVSGSPAGAEPNSFFFAGAAFAPKARSSTSLRWLSRMSAIDRRLPTAQILSKCCGQKPSRFVSMRTSGSIMAAPVI